MKHSPSFYIALAALITGAFTHIYAQENDEVLELEDLVVVGKYLQADQINALKSPTPIENIPQSVRILTSDLMVLQDLTSMSDIANYVPGVEAGQGEGHRDDILFRGQKSTADFFVDGVRDDVQYFRPLYNVEQVEVLKGANALFFGRGGIGGLINRVSKTAQMGEDFTNYSLSLDDLGESNLQIDSNMSIAPNAALRLNYYTEDLENHRDFFYGDNSGFNPTLQVQLSNNTSVHVSYENLEQERFIDRGIPSLDRAPVESLIDTTFADRDYNKSTVDADIFKVSADHQLGDRTKLRINYTENDFSKMYQNYYATSTVTIDIDGDEQVSVGGYHDETERESTLFSADLIGEKAINGFNHKYVLGIESIDTTNDNFRYKNSGGATKIANLDQLADAGNTYSDGITSSENTILNDDTEATLDVTSLYFSDEIALSEKIDLVIGGRLDDFELSVVDNKDASNSANKKDKEFSPRLGFVYKPTNNISWYASYSETFIPKSGEQYADLKGDKAGLDSDVYENTEIGVKFDLYNGISVTAAYYDLTSVKPEFASVGVLEIKERTYQGYEFQAIGNVSENWFISGGVNFVNEAEAIPEVPGSTFSLWNLFKLDDKLSLGLGIINKGATAGKGSVDLPSYTRIDAAAYYKIDNNMRVQLNLENITDALYFPNSYGDHQVTVGAPFHATLKIVGSF